MATLSYQVDVDTKRAEARIGAFALDMRRRISDAIRSLPEIELDANATPAQRELQRIRAELKELSTKKIGVDIDAATADAQLRKLHAELEKLSADSVDIQVKADTAAALSALKIVDKQVDRIDGRKATVKVDVDKSLSDSIVKVAAFTRALGTLALPATALSIVPQLGAIATSLTQLSGAALLAPAAGAAAAGAIGTLVVGMQNFGNVIKDLNKGDAKKFAEDLAKLAPAAKQVAITIRDLGPAWKSVQLDVQQKLFAGLSGEIADLAKVWLPTLRGGMGSLAVELNTAAAGFISWARSGAVIRDVQAMFLDVRDVLQKLIPAGINVAAALTDIGTVGTKFLPGMAQSFTDLTVKFRTFIAQARESGQLQQWIQTGIDKVEQLGRIAGNVGGSLLAIFKAANSAGADFFTTLEKVTGEIKNFLQSGTGQNALSAVFTAIRDAVDALLPAVKAVATEIAQGIVTLAPKVKPLAEAISNVLQALAPLIPAAVDVATSFAGALTDSIRELGGVLKPLVQVISSVVSGLSGMIGPLLAAVAAWKAFSLVGDIITGFGAKIGGALGSMGNFATAATGSAAAGERFAVAGNKIGSAFGAVGSALPAIGLIIAAAGIAADQANQRFERLTQALVDGGHAAAEARDANSGFGNGILAVLNPLGEMTHGLGAAQAAAQAFKAGLDPLALAQQNAKTALNDYLSLVDVFGEKSPFAQQAAGNLAEANRNLADKTKQASDATKTLGDEIATTQQQQAAAANSQVAYQQAVLNVADASDRAAEAVRLHGANSREAQQAQLGLQQACLNAAAAAQRQAEDTATASGATNVAEIGAQAYKEELLRQAGTMTGPLRDALIAQANGLDTASQAQSTAEIQARLHKDELGRLAGQATGPLRQALLDAKTNFDNLGGANATAEQKARAQKDELQRLADKANGPVRQALLDMASQIRTLPDKVVSVTVTALGKVGAITFSQTLAAATSGFARGGIIDVPVRGRFADGGVLPGYTPGRDVHTYRSATGSVLQLSGGEAIMRPEWTQAVSPRYVNAANDAARSGGLRGVTDFLRRTAPRGRGVEGVYGDGNAFAAGGIYGGNVQRFASGATFVIPGLSPSAAISQEQSAVTTEMTNRTVAATKAFLLAVIKKMFSGGPGLAWAKTQVGKPYIWGAVGPGGYDCSGFMSAITNVIRGRYPYSRVGSTGTFPWGGFAPGLGPGFSIGAFRGNPGHMAGTIGGVNVESAGGVGVRVGGPVGAGSGMFNIRGHLVADQGGVLPSGYAALNLTGRDELVLPPAAAAQAGAVYNVNVTFQNALNTMDDALMRQAAIRVADEIDKVKRSRA